MGASRNDTITNTSNIVGTVVGVLAVVLLFLVVMRAPAAPAVQPAPCQTAPAPTLYPDLAVHRVGG